MAQFKKTVILYPLCIMAIWLPCVFLGVMANRAADVPEIKAKQEARRTLATQGATLSPGGSATSCARRWPATTCSCCCSHRYAPLWLAGLLGAGIMAAVMASDSQILALSTMFTEDVFAHYGGKARFGERVQVQTGRAFVVLLTVFAYVVALNAPETIFELAIQYALLRLRRAVAAADRGALLAAAARSGARSPSRCGWRRRWPRSRSSRQPCPRRRPGRPVVVWRAGRPRRRWRARRAAPPCSASCPWCRWCWSPRC